MKTHPGNITVPRGQAWYADRFADHVGGQPLSPEAREVRGIALSFPQFQAPGLKELLRLHRDAVTNSGSGYRPFGEVKIKAAIAELKRRGFYGIRRASLGRGGAGTSDGRPRMAFARSYGNEPYGHLEALEALTDDEIRYHDSAFRRGWVRYLETGHFRDNVVSLDKHRLPRAG